MEESTQRCPKCRKQFKVLAGEEGEHCCPRCGYHPSQEREDEVQQDNLLQMYTQPSHNMEAVILGNVEGLEALRNELDRVIKEVKKEQVDSEDFVNKTFINEDVVFTPPDGECYEVLIHVIEDEDDFYFRDV